MACLIITNNYRIFWNKITSDTLKMLHFFYKTSIILLKNTKYAFVFAMTLYSGLRSYIILDDVAGTFKRVPAISTTNSHAPGKAELKFTLM